jgi:hypothetical protein
MPIISETMEGIKKKERHPHAKAVKYVIVSWKRKEVVLLHL